MKSIVTAKDGKSIIIQDAQGRQVYIALEHISTLIKRLQDHLDTETRRREVLHAVAVVAAGAAESLGAKVLVQGNVIRVEVK